MNNVHDFVTPTHTHARWYVCVWEFLVVTVIWFLIAVNKFGLREVGVEAGLSVYKLYNHFHEVFWNINSFFSLPFIFFYFSLSDLVARWPYTLCSV